MADKELNILVKMKTDIDASMQKVINQLNGVDNTAKKANVSMFQAFQNAERSMVSAIRTVTRVGFIFSATFGAMAAAVINAGVKIKELDEMSIDTGKSFEELSNKIYGFNVATDGGREGARSFQLMLQDLEGVAIKTGSAIGTAANKVWAFVGAAMNGFKVSVDEVEQEMNKNAANRKSVDEIKQEISAAEDLKKITQSTYDYKMQKLDEYVAKLKLSHIEELNYGKDANGQPKKMSVDDYKVMQEQELRRESMGFQRFTDFIDGQYKSTITSMKSVTSSFFEDAFHGQLKKGSEYFAAFGDILIKTFANVITEMIANWLVFDAISGLGGMFGGIFHGGGAVGSISGGGSGGDANSIDLGRILRVDHQSGGHAVFHSGGVIRAHSGLAVDEVPIIAQTGEGVLSRRGMNSLGVGNLKRLNRGEGIDSGGVTINNTMVVHAWGPDDLLKREKEITAMFERSIKTNGSVRNTIRTV